MSKGAKKPMPTNAKITVRLANLLEAVGPLQTVMGQKIDAVTAFRIKKTLRVVDNTIEDYQETRQKKLKEFCKPDKKRPEKVMQDKVGNVVFLNDDAKNQFSDEMEALMKEEQTIKADHVKLADLEEVSISPNDMLALDWLIVE